MFIFCFRVLKGSEMPFLYVLLLNYDLALVRALRELFVVCCIQQFCQFFTLLVQGLAHEDRVPHPGL